MRIVGLTAAALSVVSAFQDTFQCSCAGNWPRAAMWHVGSAMMENGMNFTDFDNPEDSPVGLIWMMDNEVMEPMSRMMKSLSRQLNMDMDMVVMGFMKSQSINGMPIKDTADAFIDQISKIVGNQDMATFYEQHLENWESTMESFEEIMNQNNSYALQQWAWANAYVNNNNVSWESAITDIATAFHTNNLNRTTVTDFISFFRQYMIDWLNNTDYEAQMQDALVWLEPIIQSNDWENIDNLLAAPEFVEAVYQFQRMLHMVESGVNWNNPNDVEQWIANTWPSTNNDTAGDQPFVDQMPPVAVRKRRAVGMPVGLPDIDAIISTISEFLPQEAQQFVAAIQQSPFMRIVGKLMILGETDELEMRIGYVIADALAAYAEVNEFQEPIQNYEQANQALMASDEMQALTSFFMTMPEQVEGQLIPFKIKDLMDLVWDFLNAGEITDISEAQDYFALYWFEQVSAEKHVDVIYALSDLMKLATGYGIDDIPMFLAEVESWMNDMMAMAETPSMSRQRRDHVPLGHPDGPTVLQVWGCACDPMDPAFTLEGKMAIWEQESPNTIESPESPDEPSEPSEPSEPCMLPVTQNMDVFNWDGTVRPLHNAKMCATTRNNRNKQAVKWANCEAAAAAGHKMNFTYHWEYVNIGAPIKFDDMMLYPTDSPNETWIPVGTIRSGSNNDRCWTIANPRKATSRSSVIFLKNCDPTGQFAGRQLWTVMGGNILLVSTDGRPVMNSKWRSFVGVPYLGEGQKLKTRRVHDIAMGGHQLIADGVHWWNPSEMHGGNQPEMAEPMPEPNQPHPAMPDCLFIGTEEMVAMAQAMFQSPGHENYSDCVAMTHEQAEMAATGMN